MKYLEILQAVNPTKALKELGRNPNPQGAYLHFDCPCGKTASIKAYGIKKNLWICNHCKDKGHIIGLVMKLKELAWEEAKEFLKPFCSVQRMALIELPFRYEMAYSDILEKKGLSKEFCERLGIGKPGKKQFNSGGVSNDSRNMLAGCIAFPIRHEGKLIAYIGIRIKDGSPVFHKSFNPELLLWGHDHEFKDKEVLLARDMFECARMMSEGKLAVSNFGLPYLSSHQLDALKRYRPVVFKKDDSEIAKQIMDSECCFKIV